jgi:tetratricopeptide (TPR) repeat protein
MLDALASEKPELLKDGERYLRQALEIAPDRQEIYYHLAVNLGKQDRFDEAIQVARQGVALSPSVIRARFYLGLILAGSGRMEEAREEINGILEELSGPYSGLLASDFNSLLMLYHIWGLDNRVAELAQKSVRGELPNRFVFEDQYYILTLGLLAYERDTENFVMVAEFVKRKFPQWNDQMEVLIDLVQKGRWDMLDAMQ